MADVRGREVLSVAVTECPQCDSAENLESVIMEKKELRFRSLYADEIDCRVGTQTDKGVSLLLYKDARVDMRLLDEVVGCMNWQRRHELINGNLFCTVSIKDEATGEWVSKQDVGTESNTEKEKGQASDAFKRACFNWGIGRELYTSPFVWVTLREDEWRVDRNGRKQPKTRFYVADIQYKDGVVSYLVINDDKDKERFRFGTPQEVEATMEEAIKAVGEAQTMDELKAIWLDYKELLGNAQAFIDAVNSRKDEIQKGGK